MNRRDVQSAPVAPEHPLLDPLKDYANFPKTEAWLNSAWAELFNP